MADFRHVIRAYPVILTDRSPVVQAGLRRAGERACVCRRCGHLLHREVAGRSAAWRHFTESIALVAVPGA